MILMELRKEYEIMRIGGALVWALLSAFVPASGFADSAAWHIECFGLDGHTMAVKAISGSGRLYDVIATRMAGGKLFDVNAIKADGETLPVKVVPARANDPYSDVKAITGANTLVAVKAITTTGSSLDVKAFYNENTGEYDIKCLTLNGRRLGIKAVSPDAQVYDVKGIKALPTNTTAGIEIKAHIKARPQRPVELP